MSVPKYLDPGYAVPKPVYKLSPELCDGEHWTLVTTPAQVAEAVKIWAENEESVEDGFSVEVVEMSERDIDALPDV